MPSRTSNRNKLALPTYPPPEGRVCIPVTIPNDPHWIALFTGAIYRLSQQIWYDRDSTHTAQLVAAVWRDIYLATMESAWDCAGSGMFNIRLKPGSHCVIQKTTDGVTWVDAIDMAECWQNGIKRNPATGGLGWEVQDMGFYEFPDGPWTEPAPQVVYPTPKVQQGATDDQKRCNAAYGAAIALQALYQQTWGVFIGWANKAAWTIAQEFADMADDILGANGPLDQFLSIGQDLHEQESSFQEAGFPSDLIHEVQCILYNNSTITDDVVTFNRAGVIADFAVIGGSPFGGLNFLLTLYLGDEGLNAAGNVAAGDGDCATCGELIWCHAWDFEATDGGFTARPGAYANTTYLAGTGWRSGYANNNQEQQLGVIKTWTQKVNITQARVKYNIGGSFQVGNANLGFLRDGVQVFNIPLQLTGPTKDVSFGYPPSQPLAYNDVNGVQLNFSGYPANYNYQEILKFLQLEGTGIQPFGFDNC